jgi:micrococcal nuclease
MPTLRWSLSALLILIASGMAQAASLPACVPPIEASNVHVDRVEKNGVLVLDDGRAVRAEGLLLPAGARDRAPGFLADEALSMLNDFARGRSATLAVRPPKEDRYGRLRAQVFFTHGSDEPWLQIAMLRRGLARVSIAPDRRECAAALYDAEDAARKKKYGIWAQSAYAVRAPGGLGNDTDTFQIVQGTILTADVKSGRAYLDFGDDWRKDFSVNIAPEDLKNFRDAGIDPRSYEGKTVRVRGWIERKHGSDARSNGPEMEVAIPEAIEVVPSR